jgi:cytochrome c-type biogenesis protein CcmH/NrfG
MEKPRAAWNAVFPEWSLDVPGATEALDAELRHYASGGRYAYRKLEVSVEVSVEESALSPPAVHTLRLDLARRWPRARLQEEIDEALGEDPGHVRALEALAELDAAEAAALARRAVAAHPEDPRAWSFLGRRLARSGPDAPEREAALRKALALAPERLEGSLDLAQELLAQGRAAEAELLAMEAVRRAPWSSGAFLLLGSALALQRRCGDAAAAVQVALALLGERAPATARRAAQATARDVERRCPAPSATPAGAPGQ